MFVHLLSLQPHWALAEPQQGALPGGREGRPKGIQPFVGHRCTGGGGIFSVPILCLGYLSFDPLLRLPHAVPSHSLFQNHKSLLCFYKCHLHVQILRGCLEYILLICICKSRQLRATSRKPDEMYGLVERFFPGVRKIGMQALQWLCVHGLCRILCNRSPS